MKSGREVDSEKYLEKGDFGRQGALRQKVAQLQDRIRKLEDNPSGDKRHGWHSHGERNAERKRVPHKSGTSGCVETKGKIDYFGNRSEELVREAESLRLEHGRLLERSKDIQEKRKSYTVLEGELRARQNDRLERHSKLDIAKARNQQLEDELCSLQKDLRRMASKAADDDMLLEALTSQQGSFQDLIERQRKLRESDHRRFCEDLRELHSKHTTNIDLLNQLQELSADSDFALEDLQHPTPFTIYVMDETEETDTPSVTSSTTAVHPPEDTTVSKEVTPGVATQNSSLPPDEGLQNLKWDLEALRQVFESSQDELERLAEITASNNSKLNEWRGQLLHSKALYAQRTSEVRALEEKRTEDRSSTAKADNNPHELLIKQDVEDEERRFLVDLWHSVAAHSESLFRIYETSVDRTKKLFVDALRELDPALVSKLRLLRNEALNSGSVIQISKSLESNAHEK